MQSYFPFLDPKKPSFLTGCDLFLLSIANARRRERPEREDKKEELRKRERTECVGLPFLPLLRGASERASVQKFQNEREKERERDERRPHKIGMRMM